MKKKLFSVLLIIIMALSLFSGVTAAQAPTLPDDIFDDTGPKVSGNTAYAPLTEPEIAQMMADAPLTLPTALFEEEPSLADPHTPGKLTTEALQAATARLNLLRRLAGLPAVQADATLNESAQYGAVLLTNTAFSHTPAQPDGMSREFYEKGYAATSTSNLAGGVSLTKAVDLFMDDSDANNLDKLGHRRWQLNPQMGKVGFGYAYDDPADNTAAENDDEDPLFNYCHYTVEQIFDTSAEAFDYEFIGWPASGSFPNDLFNGKSAWSITLNEEKYQKPVPEDLKVTLTAANGAIWTFDGTESYSVSNSKYFNVENSAYGVPNCIIFRPDGVDRYQGTYRVTVTGLKDRFGKAVDFSYQVDFFDADDYITGTNHVCTVKRFADLKHTAWYHDAVQYAVDHGLMNGTATTKFEPNAKLTRSMIVQVLYNREGKPRATESPFTDVKPSKWYADAIAWSAENEIVKGFEDATFRPESPITRQQMATILYRYAEYKGYDVSARGDLSKFKDGDKTAAWATDAVQWAVATGLMQGDEKGFFDPDGTATRAQVATVLMNYCEKIAK